jgi:dipeptidase
VCDLIVALPWVTGWGRTLFAKNSDRPRTEHQVLEWHDPRTETATRTTYLTIGGPAAGRTLGVLGSRPAWMWGFEHGINEAGVAAGNATIYTTLDPRPFPDALTGMDLVRLALERADTAAGAVATIRDLVAEHGQGGSGHDGRRRPYWSAFLVADPSSAWVVETSGDLVVAQPVVDSWALSNRPTIPSFAAEHTLPSELLATMVDPRLDAGRAALADPPITAERLRRHLASHDGGPDGWTVCMHVDGGDCTTAAMVAELDAESSTVWVAEGSPCEVGFAERTVSRSPSR